MRSLGFYVIFASTTLTIGCSSVQTPFFAYRTTIVHSSEHSISFANGQTASVTPLPSFMVPIHAEYFVPGTATQPVDAAVGREVVVYQRDWQWSLCLDGQHYPLSSLTSEHAFSSQPPLNIRYHQIENLPEC